MVSRQTQIMMVAGRRAGKAHALIQELQRQLADERARLDYIESRAIQAGQTVIVPEYRMDAGTSLRDAIDAEIQELCNG